MILIGFRCLFFTEKGLGLNDALHFGGGVVMRKAELLFLEKIFAEEITGGMLQSKSKMAKKLQDEGYIQEIEKHFGPVVCKGYILTLMGNATYCMSDLCK